MISLPHDRSCFFQTEHYKNSVLQFFHAELENDGIDLTAEFCVEKTKKGSAYIIAKQKGILAGKKEIDLFFSEHFSHIDFQWKKNDGECFEEHQKIVEISGNARDILKIERFILNVLSRLSGIATSTKHLCALSHTKLAATRKTQWGFLDKKAVHIGGGLTHRIGLFDAILIKENHLLAGEGIEDVIEKLSTYDSEQEKLSKTPGFYEIEVETETEFRQVFTALQKNTKRDWNAVIMFDNFSPQEITTILKTLPSKKERNSAKIFLEISGGITEKNLKNYSDLGADVISLGALTHSVLPIDFSLRFNQ